ncbi:ATP-grasp domain-containing protein [Thermaerobacter litoralis]
MEAIGATELALQSNLTYWWPRTAHVNVPKPRTVIVADCGRALREAVTKDRPLPPALRAELEAAAASIGYPVFMRTDAAAAKHSWRQTCFVECREDLVPNLFRLVEENLLADILGLPFTAVVFREVLPLDARFVAFHGRLPIAPERRYFVRDGRVETHYPYWPEAAIRPCQETPANWRERLRAINQETPEEVALLTTYAERIGAALPGYWSVDFARTKAGTWYWIDAARGELSWRPDGQHDPDAASSTGTFDWLVPVK